MVGDDSDGVGGADEPGTHITESVNNGEKFFVMDFVINFSRGEFARVKSNRMEKVVVVGLKKDESKGKVRSIGNNCGRESRIEMLEERSGCEGEFKGFKRFDGRGGGRFVKECLEVFVVRAWRGRVILE